MADGALDDFLDGMLQDRLMLRLDGHYLSLATNAFGDARPAAAGARAIAERHLTF
jgi:hypothetical protein